VRNPFPANWGPRPRLMATKARIERLPGEIKKGGKPAEALRDEIFRKARKALLGSDPLERFPDDPLREARRALRRVQQLGLAWFLTADPVFAERGKQVLQAICAAPDWNPSHFLCTAELTHAVAIGYDWFYDRLGRAQQEQCEQSILEKGLKPGHAVLMSNQRAWPTNINNWNIVCNGGLMIGALAIAERHPGWPAKVFLRCLDSIPTGFRGYSPDGSWDEGPGYWAYATEYAAYLISALNDVYGHDFGLAGLPGFCDTGFFYMHAEGSTPGKETAWKLFNYSDCADERTGSWSLRWLAQKCGEPIYNWVALRDQQQTPMDLLWFSADTGKAGEKELPRNAVFRGIANVAMLRGGWGDKVKTFKPMADNRGHVYLGIRGGVNARDGVHAHLDLGSFVLDSDGLRWAVDLGPVDPNSDDHYADYKLPGYFDVELERRFRYYRTGTVGHNTLHINGFNQALGAQTEIVAFGESADDEPELAIVVVDLTPAYPDCLRARRGFALIEGRDVLIVDELTPKNQLNLVWQMHTPAQATAGNPARLSQGGKEFFAQILEPAGSKFAVEPALVRQPGEAPNKDVVKLVFGQAKLKEPTRIAVYLSGTQAGRTLSGPLSEPLWRWIEWAGMENHRRKKGESFTGRRTARRKAAIQSPSPRAPERTEESRG